MDSNVIDDLTLSLRNRLQKVYKKARKYTKLRMGYPRRELVYFVSFPKSGRTWVKGFLSAYYYELCPSLILEGKHSSYNERVPRVVFMHRGYRHANELRRVHLRGKKFVLLMRDPRDTLVSFYHHLRYRNDPIKKVVERNWDTLTIKEMLHDQHLGIRKIIEFNNAWFSILSNADRCLIVRYEDLHSSPDYHFDELLQFLEGEYAVNQFAFDRAIYASQFQYMKEKERLQGSEESTYTASHAGDERSFKARKGLVGGHVDYLDADDLAYCNSQMRELHPTISEHYLYPTGSERTG